MGAVGRTPQTDDERQAQALAWALSHINRRERTTMEVRAHLARKGVSDRTAERVVEELVRSLTSCLTSDVRH